MGLQKYRADYSVPQTDNSNIWYAYWFGGPTISKIDNCQWDTLEGNIRRTVYITGEPDTYFSIPAVLKYSNCIIKGYVTMNDDSVLVFNHVYYG